MTEIKISIECDGKYCGECRLKESSLSAMYCMAFEGELKMDLGESGSGDFKGYLRLPECLDAGVEHENQPDIWSFKKKYNVRHRENEEACCNNCQSFLFDKTGEVFKFTDIKTLEVKNVQLGECLLAKEERTPVTKTVPWDVCDAYKLVVKEVQNGEG